MSRIVAPSHIRVRPFAVARPGAAEAYAQTMALDLFAGSPVRDGNEIGFDGAPLEARAAE